MAQDAQTALAPLQRRLRPISPPTTADIEILRWLLEARGRALLRDTRRQARLWVRTWTTRHMHGAHAWFDGPRPARIYRPLADQWTALRTWRLALERRVLDDYHRNATPRAPLAALRPQAHYQRQHGFHQQRTRLRRVQLDYHNFAHDLAHPPPLEYADDYLMFDEVHDEYDDMLPRTAWICVAFLA